MGSLKAGAGYLIIDHRDSPGLSAADVAQMPGAVAAPAGTVLERDVKQCSHCQRDVLLEPLRTRARGYCPKCDGYVCDGCEAIRVASGGACVPFAARLEQAQATLAKFAGQPDHPDANPDVVLTDAP
jgi:hypothetical protein